MALTQYFTATTLDGFIADADNSLDWLFAVEREDEGRGFARFLDGVGAMAMGATTYQWVLDHEQPARASPTLAGVLRRPAVLGVHATASSQPIPGADLRFVRGDVAAVHAEMVEAAGGRNVWLVGGGDLVGQFHDAGLLDQVAGQHRAGDAGVRRPAAAAPHRGPAAGRRRTATARWST